MEQKHPEPLECQEHFAIALKSSLAHTCPSAPTKPLPGLLPTPAMFSQGLSKAQESGTPVLTPCTPREEGRCTVGETSRAHSVRVFQSRLCTRLPRCSPSP